MFPQRYHRFSMVFVVIPSVLIFEGSKFSSWPPQPICRPVLASQAEDRNCDIPAPCQSKHIQALSTSSLSRRTTSSVLTLPENAELSTPQSNQNSFIHLYVSLKALVSLVMCFHAFFYWFGDWGASSQYFQSNFRLAYAAKQAVWKFKTSALQVQVML